MQQIYQIKESEIDTEDAKILINLLNASLTEITGNSGAARKIIESLEAYAVKEGIKRIQLETRIMNQHAVDFYNACHYERCSNYGKYKDREDAICFLKQLA